MSRREHRQESTGVRSTQQLQPSQQEARQVADLGRLYEKGHRGGLHVAVPK